MTDEKVSFEEYKGRKILYVDFSGLTDSVEIINIIKKAQEMIVKSKDVLLLINTKDSMGTPKVISAYKDFAKTTKPYIKKDAVCCMSKTHKIFLESIRFFTNVTLKEFDAKEEAEEYLVSENQ